MIAQQPLAPVARLLSAMLLVLSMTSSVPQASGAWTQFQGDARHSGYVSSDIDASLLTLRWELPSLDLSAGQGERAFAMDEGDVYVTLLDRNDGRRYVNRLNGRTGQVQWRQEIPGVFESPPPSIQDGVVYVHRLGHSVGPTPPALLGFASDTGSQLFMTTHIGQGDSGSRPTITNGSVLAAGGYYGGLNSFGLEGNLDWFVELPQTYGWIPAADSDRAYVYIGQLFVINQSTGAIEHTIPHPRNKSHLFGDLQSVTLTEDGSALALARTGTVGQPNNRGLVSFDIQNSNINWEVDGAFSGNPATGNGIIAIPDGNRLRILDVHTGNTLWTWSGSNLLYNVVLSDEYAFVNSGGSVHAISLQTRKSVWNSGGITGDLAFDGKLLMIGDQRGIYAYSLVPEPSTLQLLGLAAFVAIGGSLRRLRARR